MIRGVFYGPNYYLSCSSLSSSTLTSQGSELREGLSIAKDGEVSFAKDGEVSFAKDGGSFDSLLPLPQATTVQIRGAPT